MTSDASSQIPRHPSEFACIDLVNSAFTHHLGTGPVADRLSQQAWRAWFLDHHGLEVGKQDAPPIAELSALRHELRRMLERWGTTGSVTPRDAQRLDRWVGRIPIRQRVARAATGRLGLAIEPITRDWDWAIARIAASAVELVACYTPERLKICANPDCSWMFYDHTLNRSKRFCSTDLCGNVTRVRRFRTRTPAR
jgi:predicted RNA-binding Zn ribbon-like protein